MGHLVTLEARIPIGSWNSGFWYLDFFQVGISGSGGSIGSGRSSGRGGKVGLGENSNIESLGRSRDRKWLETSVIHGQKNIAVLILSRSGSWHG